MQGIQVKCITILDRGMVEVIIHAGQLPAGIYTYLLIGDGGTSVAGETSVSLMSFEEKKGFFGGKVPDLQGYEYYIGGIFELNSDKATSIQHTQSTPGASFVSSFDWRNRHGRNWITSVKNQYPCGSCGIFAVIGSIESLINLYFNQILNKDLSEQEMVSCMEY